MAFKTDASKIKRWREERQWSQEHLAELAGVGVRTIQRIETGDAASRDTLMALAAAFDVDVSALSVDPEVEARTLAQEKFAKGLAAARVGLWVHLASYALGVLVFIAISVSEGAFVMKTPLMWWTVGAAAHCLVIFIVWIAGREAATR